MGVDPGWRNCAVTIFEIHKNGEVRFLLEKTFDFHIQKKVTYHTLIKAIRVALSELRVYAVDVIYIEGTGKYSMYLERLTTVLHAELSRECDLTTHYALSKRSVHKFFGVPCGKSNAVNKKLFVNFYNDMVGRKPANHHCADSFLIGLCGALQKWGKSAPTISSLVIMSAKERCVGYLCSQCQQPSLAIVTFNSGKRALKCHGDLGGHCTEVNKKTGETYQCKTFWPPWGTTQTPEEILITMPKAGSATSTSYPVSQTISPGTTHSARLSSLPTDFVQKFDEIHSCTTEENYHLCALHKRMDGMEKTMASMMGLLTKRARPDDDDDTDLEASAKRQKVNVTYNEYGSPTAEVI